MWTQEASQASLSAVALAAALLLFHHRARTGVAPLFAGAGALVAWSAITSAEAALPWAVGLAAAPALVLALHVRDGTRRARQLTWSLVAVLVVLAAVEALAAGGLPEAARTGRAAALLGVEVLGALCLWELIAPLPLPLVARVALSLLVPLGFDRAVLGVSTADAADWHTGVLNGLRDAALVCFGQTAVLTLYLTRWAGRRFTEAPAGRAVFDVLGVMLGLRDPSPRADRMRDPESGLYHRTFLLDRLPAELERADALASPVGLLWIEIGSGGPEAHEARDALLETLRLTDLASRWVDDGFVAILPGADRRAAERRGEEVRGRLGDSDALRIGVAVYPLDGNRLDELLAQARKRAR